ncbi:MAG: hypothetical protein ABR607_08030 [Pyrinomonadaceae bacterium]
MFRRKSSPTKIRAKLLFGGLPLLFLTALTTSAQAVRWAGDVSPGRVNILHAPDNRFTSVDPPLTATDFGPVMRYEGLARLLGMPERELAKADVIAFEGNGGSGAGIESGWESSTWTFTDGTHTYVAKFNETVGHTSDVSIIATGSVKGADGTIFSGGDAYRAFFGICSPDPSTKVVSYILFNLHSLRPAIDAASARFTIKLENGHRADGSFGEGTPDPDAIGILSSCPKK